MESDLKHKEIIDRLTAQDEVLKGISTRQDNHEKNDDNRFNAIPSKDDMRAVVETTMKEVLFSGSKWTYRAIIVIAVLFGSILTIFGGFKAILMWFGFQKL